jgi:sensor domain CHASE-containing protein
MSTLFIAAFFLVAMIFAAVLVVAVLMLRQTLSQDSRQTGRQQAES